MQSHAAILTRLHRPLSLKPLEMPAPKAGQVLIRLHYSGLCRSQMMEMAGLHGDDPYLPHCLGHEACGRVVAIGAGVEKVAVGDKVVLSWNKGQGMDPGGFTVDTDDGMINFGPICTFTELALVSENRCYKIADDFPEDLATLIGCCLSTGVGMVENDCHVSEASSVAVFGLGGIGLCALLAATHRRAHRLIAIDNNPEKLALAKSWGATHTLNPNDDDPVAAIRDLSDGIGVDVAIDASGLASVIEQAFQAVKRQGGQCVFASHPATGDLIQLDPFELICGKSITGSWGGGCDMDAQMPFFTDFCLTYSTELRQLISHHISLADINKGFDLMASGQGHRILVKFPAA